MNRIIIVTGLPRSGTSLLMQMLSAGGVPILHDGVRSADADNPRGYFEYEAVKRLDRDASWMPQAEGKALKVTSPLLPHLPPGYAYEVIEVRRPIEEVLRSQGVMMQRRGLPAPGAEEDAALRAAFEQVLQRAQAWCDAHAARVLTLEHGALLRESGQQAQRVADFVGLPEAATAMAEVVDAALYRNRST